MRVVFADTFYWIAVHNRRDEWHEKVRALSRMIEPMLVVTTDEVLVEVLTFFGSHGPEMRLAMVRWARRAMRGPNIRVLPQTRDSFESGLRLYERRLDRDYSLTDCISMETMRREGLREILTHDRHFAQEGFALLLR